MARATPKLDWLEDARAELNADPGFRALGSTDLVLGLSLGEETRLIRFEAFGIAGIQSGGDLRDASLVLRMSPKDWNAYLRRRAGGGGPSLLTLDLQEGIFHAADPLGAALLPRYNLTLQAFVDAGARLAG